MGIFDGIPQDIETEKFFLEELPKAFERETEGLEVSGMEGTELKVVFDVSGQPYGLVIKDAKELEVGEGMLDGPDIVIILSEEAWRKALSGDLGNALDMFTDFTKFAERRRYDIIKDVSGKLNLVLDLGGGETFQATAKFQNADTPEVTITVELAPWQEIMAGTTQAAMAFMGGKMKLTGEMPLAMQLNGLM